MKSTLKTVVISSAAGCLLLAGATAASASTPTAAPTNPVECLTPAIEDPAGALTGTLEDPVGTLKADAACLTGQD